MNEKELSIYIKSHTKASYQASYQAYTDYNEKLVDNVVNKRA